MAAAYKGKFNESDKAQEIRSYLLQSECIHIGDDTNFNKDDDSLVNCILGFYKDNNKCSTEFGEITIDSSSIQNCISHRKRWNTLKWYFTLKDILENGEVILPMRNHNYHNKKLKTGIIAAPVECDGNRYFCSVVVSSNLNKKLEVYDFNYFTKEKLSEIAANNKRSVHDSSCATSPQVSKSPANVLINLLFSNEEDLNKPKDENVKQQNIKNENYTYYNTMKNNNKALYESIMKDVAKVVKRKLNEDYDDDDFDVIEDDLYSIKDYIPSYNNKDLKPVRRDFTPEHIKSLYKGGKYIKLSKFRLLKLYADLVNHNTDPILLKKLRRDIADMCHKDSID